MAIKDILLHVDNSKACGKRIDAAVKLARGQDAHLTGLYVRPDLTLPGYAEVQIGPDWIEAQERAADSEASKAESAFRQACERAGIGSEWRSEPGSTAVMVTQHARYADLVILGQREEGDPYSPQPGALGAIVLGCGRPVLVIPYIGAADTIGENVLVAWNATRESVRAVNDALPLLARAKRVHVIAINPEAGASGDGDIPSADICHHLARHGVKAEAEHIEARDIEAGDMLLSRASDEGADLIVSGGYGHSRMRELVLGGVTRHLLEHMTVPVLMSH